MKPVVEEEKKKEKAEEGEEKKDEEAGEADKEETKADEPELTDFERCPMGRGYEDPKILRKFVCGNVEQWKGLDHEKIEVVDCSGYGGSKTYKLTCKDANPDALCFHCRKGEVIGLSDARAAAAAKMFEQFDAAPKRLAEGEDWFVDVFGGFSLGPEPCRINSKRIKFTLVEKDDEDRLVFDKLTPESHLEDEELHKKYNSQIDNLDKKNTEIYPMTLSSHQNKGLKLKLDDE